MFCLLPWEIDPEQPRVRARLVPAIRRYTNLSRCNERLRPLLRAFRFAPARSVLERLAIQKVSAVGNVSKA